MLGGQSEDPNALRSRIASSRWARAAAFPARFSTVARYDLRILRSSARWLAHSKEYTNYTYDLTARNRNHLAWWVSSVSGVSHEQCRQYLEEIHNNDFLRRHIADCVRNSPRRGISDLVMPLGRREGWYAMTRALKPRIAVEAGTDKGLGALAIGLALRANGQGHLHTVDLNPSAGTLLPGFSDVVTMHRGQDSRAFLAEFSEQLDLFVQDADHSRTHETAELRAVESKLRRGAVVLSDNAHVTDALATWAQDRHWSFLYFAEEPEDHWHPGNGIGAAWKSVDRSADATARY